MGFLKNKSRKLKNWLKVIQENIFNPPIININLIRHRHWFIISPIKSTESENIIINQTDKEIEFALGKLRIEETTNT